MANIANSAQAPATTRGSLSDRTSRYRDEIEKVVTQVGEHPLYEMKRACALQSLAEKIEFVKDIQSIATSRIDIEKYLIIGADGPSKSFHAVRNLAEFDDANIRQVLEKYLNPVPEFEVFTLTSSAGVPFVLFVIPKQKHRRILAKSTVEDPSSPSRPKILIREGDLWTKGANTGKRLAKPEDWDEIYEEMVEARVEHQTRQRTAHMLEEAIAREKVHSNSRVALPTAFTDTQFKALLEEICGTQDTPRFNLLLERLRDDLVESWHQVGGYEQSGAPMTVGQYEPAAFRTRIREHIANVFRPAMHWLTLAGIYVVKNGGPTAFLDSIVDLLGEVFDSSHRLSTLNLVAPLGATSSSLDDHLSRTVPALESLVALYLIGGYIVKRGRLQFFRSLFRPEVFSVGPRLTDQQHKAPMVFWPFARGTGEPDELWNWGGRIAYCASRIQKDTAYLTIFGSEKSAVESLCQLELYLEMNSYVAFSGDETFTKYIAAKFPNINFQFYPVLTAYSLENIRSAATSLFEDIRNGKANTVEFTSIDPALAKFWVRPGSVLEFAGFIGDLAANQSIMLLQNRRMSWIVYWPKEFEEAMKAARNRRTQSA
jgi:hypothetical protein